jgi:hypothetical protein
VRGKQEMPYIASASAGCRAVARRWRSENVPQASSSGTLYTRRHERGREADQHDTIGSRRLPARRRVEAISPCGRRRCTARWTMPCAATAIS